MVNLSWCYRHSRSKLWWLDFQAVNNRSADQRTMSLCVQRCQWRGQPAFKWRLERIFAVMLCSRCQSPLCSAGHRKTAVAFRPDDGDSSCWRRWRTTSDSHLGPATVSTLLHQHPVGDNVRLCRGPGVWGSAQSRVCLLSTRPGCLQCSRLRTFLSHF